MAAAALAASTTINLATIWAFVRRRCQMAIRRVGLKLPHCYSQFHFGCSFLEKYYFYSKESQKIEVRNGSYVPFSVPLLSGHYLNTTTLCYCLPFTKVIFCFWMSYSLKLNCSFRQRRHTVAHHVISPFSVSGPLTGQFVNDN